MWIIPFNSDYNTIINFELWILIHQKKKENWSFGLVSQNEFKIHKTNDWNLKPHKK